MSLYDLWLQLKAAHLDWTLTKGPNGTGLLGFSSGHLSTNLSLNLNNNTDHFTVYCKLYTVHNCTQFTVRDSALILVSKQIWLVKMSLERENQRNLLSFFERASCATPLILLRQKKFLDGLLFMSNILSQLFLLQYVIYQTVKWKKQFNISLIIL